MILLDTNSLSPEWVASEGCDLRGQLFASSVSAQELLGMQRPGVEAGYRYALPVFNQQTTAVGERMRPEPSAHWIADHAKARPVSKRADRQVVPRSRLRAESLELGHVGVAIAHEQGHDGLLRAYASQGLPRRTLKRVLSKWEFLREEVEALIPLDDEIAHRAVELANMFVDGRYTVKGTARNTMNDMLIAATSLVEGMTLITGDSQLQTFYESHGWTVRANGTTLVATPEPPPGLVTPAQGRSGESRGYVNRPPHIRTHIDYDRSSVPR